MPRKMAKTPDEKALILGRHDDLKPTIELARAAVLLYDAATAIRHSSPGELTDDLYGTISSLDEQALEAFDLLLKQYASLMGYQLTES